MTQRLTRDGQEFHGKVFPAEVARIRRLAKERGLCAAIALGIWAALLASAGTRVRKKRLAGDAAPSISRLAAELGIDRSTLQRYLAILEAGNLISIERPPGRKPVWLVAPDRPYRESLPSCAAGSGGESEPAGDAAEDGTPCSGERHPLPGRAAPAPPRDREGEREERVGGDKLRKNSLGQATEEELAGAVRRVLARVEEMRPEDPEGAEALEELALSEGGDVDSWRRLLELADANAAAARANAEATL